MQQPELGRRLMALRKEKNLTQEELVEKSHVSVRTIQRIEAGEVMPRMSTVRILLDALGQPGDLLSSKTTDSMSAQNEPIRHRNAMLIAAVAGLVYLVTEIISSAMDITWLYSEKPWTEWMNYLYIGLSVLLVLSYLLFARGFIILANVFENPMLKIASYLMIVAVLGVSVLDVSTLRIEEDFELLWIPYSAAAVIMGCISVVLGVGLIRLQDGMGELARVAGFLELAAGATLITVVLFFISYIIMIPAVLVECMLLYRGYEYFSRTEQ